MPYYTDTCPVLRMVTQSRASLRGEFIRYQNSELLPVSGFARVPAVYPGSAFVALLVVLSKRRISKLCAQNPRGRFDPHRPYQNLPAEQHLVARICTNWHICTN